MRGKAADSHSVLRLDHSPAVVKRRPDAGSLERVEDVGSAEKAGPGQATLENWMANNGDRCNASC